MNTRPRTLITGAGRRIGAAIARHLVASGHDVVLHFRNSGDEARALAEELTAQDAVVTLAAGDLSKPETLAEFWREIPSCTNIIHNASHYTRDKMENFTHAQLRAHLAVNLEAPLMLTQGFLAQLPKEAKGNVIVLGDDALGWSLSPEFFTYSVSKHSWVALIDLLAAACAPQVRANMIALAPTLPSEIDPEGMFERLAAHAPLKRTGTVEEVLTAIDFILKSPGLTGQTLGLGNGMAIATARA